MQNARTTHYPQYNVLNLMDEWDSHTKEIVRKRLGPFAGHSFFSDPEIGILKDIIKNITFDERDEIINWIIDHVEQTVANKTGESERKAGTPELSVLIRNGLAAIDHVSRKQFGRGFCDLEGEQQCSLVGSVQLGTAAKVPEWSQVPQKQLFNKLAAEIVSAYYSHPVIWSEIGYGGPAYPRGYVRVEFGLSDPWEARLDGE